MENIRKRLDSESAYDFEIDEDEENVLQSSLESSLENVNVVNGQGLSNRNNNQNGNVSLVSSLLLNAKLLIVQFQRFTPRHSLTSDESGIDLESPFRRPDNTACSYTVQASDEESSDDSYYEERAHSTPKTKPNINMKIPLSIFKIDLGKVDHAMDIRVGSNNGGRSNNKERIKFMVDMSNPKPKRKREYQPSAKPNAKPLAKGYVQENYKGLYDSTEFDLMLFAKCTNGLDEETGVRITNVHKIRFLHRTDGEVDEIFALPSGPARSVVMAWSDTSFPLSIASAILVEKSVTEKEVKNLFENRYLSKFKMVKGETLTSTPEFHLRFAPKIYTKFNANINDANNDLKKTLNRCGEPIVKMQVRLESISFPSVVI